MTTAAGVTIFDEASITAIGASSSSGSSGSVSVDATTVFQTGDVLWVPFAGTRTGWVRANGRTIGSSSSGATERANSDTSALYDYLWSNFSDTLCPVSGGRGASSSADFSANKAMGTLDMRGRAPFGLDDMGNSAAGVIAAGTPTTAGSGAGAETVTISQANLPNYNLTITSLNVKYDTAQSDPGSGGTRITSISSAGATTSSGGIAGTLASGGSGTATNKMPPYRLGSFFFKL
jgi:hypothetical protein